MTKKHLYVTASILAALLSMPLFGFGQSLTSSSLFLLEAEEPIVIGDFRDPYRYDGNAVRPIEGEALVDVDSSTDEGIVTATVRTTEESGPLVIAEGVELEGQITLVMTDFLSLEDFMQGGIAREIRAHGDTGVMSDVLPEIYVDVAGWGWVDLYLNGELLYEDLVGYFLLGERVRRGHELGYSVLRRSDSAFYTPDFEDKTGFSDSGDRELHLFVASSLGDWESLVEEDLALHLNLLIREEESAGGGGSSGGSSQVTSDPPAENDGGSKQKGNNGIGNGDDPQPPGNPPVNDDEESVQNGKGKKK